MIFLLSLKNFIPPSPYFQLLSSSPEPYCLWPTLYLQFLQPDDASRLNLQYSNAVQYLLPSHVTTPSHQIHQFRFLWVLLFLHQSHFRQLNPFQLNHFLHLDEHLFRWSIEKLDHLNPSPIILLDSLPFYLYPCLVICVETPHLKATLCLQCHYAEMVDS